MKKDLDTIITENINACVDEIISEGRYGYNVIKSFAVIASAKYNKPNYSLIEELRRNNYIVIPTDGKFEQLENSFCVINISLNAVKHYCSRHQQPSFIYTTVDDNMTIKNHYFKKSDISKPYDKKTNDYVCL